MGRPNEFKAEIIKSGFFSGNVINNNMKYMENRNNVTEFILLGLTRNPKTQKIIFVVFLIIYIVSMVGNVLTMVIITASPLLESFMYFFWLISLSLMLTVSIPLN